MTEPSRFQTSAMLGGDAFEALGRLVAMAGEDDQAAHCSAKVMDALSDHVHMNYLLEIRKWEDRND